MKEIVSQSECRALKPTDDSGLSSEHPVNVCHVCAGTCEGQKRILDPPDLESGCELP